MRLRPRHVVGALLVVLLVLALYVGWAAWRAKSELQQAAAQARELQSTLEAGSEADAEATLADLQESATGAREATDGPAFGLLGILPVVGDDADGVREVSAVLERLADDALPPLVETAGRLEAGSLTPRDGRVPIDELRSLQEPIQAAAEGFDAAAADLAGLDSRGYVAPLRTPFNDVRRQLARADRVLGATSLAVDLLPGMLGGQEDRRYVLMFQNNAEARATGGLPGAFAEITARDGKVELGRQASAVDFPELERPVLPLTEPELELYDAKLGTFIQDANFTPDFPRTAELVRARWEDRFDVELDGVLSVDPVAMSYLLEATGPVEVAGRTLTADNVIEEVMSRPYLEIEDPAAQDAFFRAVAQRVFDVVSTGTGDPQALLSGLAKAASEGRLLVTSFEEAEQQRLADTRVGGALTTSEDQPRVGIYLNDGTGSKLSYYLDYDANLVPEWCVDGVQQLRGSFDITSTVPPEAAADLPESVIGANIQGVGEGTQFVGATVYAPAGGQLGDLRLDGERVDPIFVEHDGRPATPVAFFLEPGDSGRLTFRVRTAPGQSGDVRLDVTPGAERGTESGLARSACGAS